MSIAEKLQAIAENEQKVFDAGKEAERIAFWETYQVGGKRLNWQYAFAHTGTWTDETYNPIYPMTLNSANINMFYKCNITDLKVPLDIRGTTLNYTFRESDIITIPELITDEGTDINQAFSGASSVVNVTITGTLAKDVKMGACPLAAASMKSVISALKDYSGTESEGVYTLTLKDSCKTELEADTETVEHNGASYTYMELITAKGWNLA